MLQEPDPSTIEAPPVLVRASPPAPRARRPLLPVPIHFSPPVQRALAAAVIGLAAESLRFLLKRRAERRPANSADPHVSITAVQINLWLPADERDR